MLSRKVNNGYLIRLEKGEELIATLSAFCQDKTVTAGFFQGLGGVSAARLGYYDLAEATYHFSEVADPVELVSLNGNVALKEGQPFLHAHATVADRNLRCYGGHVQSLTVGGTCEVYLEVFNERLERKPDAATGLDLLAL